VKEEHFGEYSSYINHIILSACLMHSCILSSFLSLFLFSVQLQTLV